MLDFANAIAASTLSQYLAGTLWITPTLQIIHIVSIGILVGSVLLVDFQILGFAGRSQSLHQTVGRFAPWFWASFAVLLVTGVFMILTEPVRELMALSFWVKMGLIVVGVAVAAATMRYARTAEQATTTYRGGTLALAGGPQVALGLPGPSGGVRLMGWLTLLVWVGVIFMGRFIAYDPQIWGELSPIY
jgi:hypothetical protein